VTPDDRPTVPELLDRLVRIPAPSGYEAPAAKAWREEASFAEVTSDALGSSIATIGKADASPLVAVVGHIDEIGLVIRHIDEKGFLHFGPIGGWDPQILIGQRVVVEGRSGPVPGVAGRKPIHLLDPEQRKKVVELKPRRASKGQAVRAFLDEVLR
jgi:endoglucanase